MHATEVQAADIILKSRPVARTRQIAYAPVESHAAWQPVHFLQALLTSLPLIVADLVAVLGSFLIAWQVTSMLSAELAADGGALVAGFVLAICVANLAAGLYPGIGLSAIAELRQTALAAAFIGPVFLFVSLMNPRVTFHWQLAIVATCCLLLVTLPTLRALTRSLFSRCGWWGQEALIVGGGSRAEQVYSFLQANRRLGLRPLGIVTDWSAKDTRSVPDYHLGPLARAAAVVREYKAPWLIVAMPERSQDETLRLLRNLRHHGPHRTVVSYVDGTHSLWSRASRCLDWPGQFGRSYPSTLARWTKRAIDLTLTVVGGIFLLPLIGLIALLIKINSPGPVIFRQQRVGQFGRRFMVCKFRTMMVDGDRVLQEYLAADPARMEAWNRDHKLADDPRVTRIGRFLRKTSLDELPQLWNVLRGQMSLVGPRPILASEIADFGASFEAFCSVLPGITGLWQVSGRNQTTYAEHIEMDRYYARNWSLWLDVYILVLTVRVVLFRHGAY